MNTRENSEIRAQAPELTRELTSDEIEVVSGGLLFIDYLLSQIPPQKEIELNSLQFDAKQTSYQCNRC